MRIQVHLPRVEPEQYDQPQRCPYAGCEGRHFRAHGTKGEVRPVRDAHVHEVRAYRWRCLQCGRTFSELDP